jgi:riboflavin synthase alpha subunit
MFIGIVQQQQRVAHRDRDVLLIAADVPLAEVTIFASIAVKGCRLTVDVPAAQTEKPS